MEEHGKYWFLTKESDFTMLSLRIFLKNPQWYCVFYYVITTVAINF